MCLTEMVINILTILSHIQSGHLKATFQKARISTIMP